MVALTTGTPKPGLVRHGTGLGEPIAGEIWKVSPQVSAASSPISRHPWASVRSSSPTGRWVTGFCCSAEAGAAGTDITRYGGWRGYLGSRAGTPTAAAAG